MSSLLSNSPKIVVLQIVILAAVFIAGWDLALKTQGNVDAKNAPVTNTRVSATSSSRLPGEAVASAKLRLAEILKMASGFDRQRKMLEFIAGLDKSTIEQLVTELHVGADDHNGTAMLDCLIERYAELDPKGALELAKGETGQKRGNLLSEALATLAGQDPASAMTALSQLPLGLERAALTASTLSTIANQNPQAALAELNNLPPGQRGGKDGVIEYKELFDSWAANDPAAAVASAKSMPASSMQYAVYTAIAQSWVQQDPTAALNWVQTLPAGPTRNGAAGQALLALALDNPSAAAGNLANFNLPAGSTRTAIVDDISYSWAEQDPTGLLQWADQNLVGSSYTTATVSALTQIAGTDPASAANYLSEHPNAGLASQAIPAIASAWSQQDPQAALTWAQSLSTDDASLRNSAINGVFSAWISSNPIAASGYIQQNLATDPSFSNLAVQVVNNWGFSDPGAALNWAQSLPTGTAQNNAVSAALTQLASVDPQSAWSDAQQLAGSSGNTAMVNVINAWATQQPDQAAAALQNLPAGSSLDSATADVAKNWLSQDPNAASQWIDTLPQGAARDSAVAQIISSVGPNDPASAFTWATTIGDETTRDTQVVQLAAQWSNQNPAAAAAAAQNALNTLTGLTSAQQTSLQKVAAKAPAP